MGTRSNALSSHLPFNRVTAKNKTAMQSKKGPLFSLDLKWQTEAMRADSFVQKNSPWGYFRPGSLSRSDMAVKFSHISSILAATGHQAPGTTICLLGCLYSLLFTVTLFLVRLAFLPQPLLGIPYNKKALSRISGDVPELKASSGIRAFMRAQFIKHNSPIVQVFMSPISKPWVLIGDFREAHDIATSRSNEFDKSKLTSDSFKGIVPKSFVSYKADHPIYKHSKDLLKDLMTPSFFRNVSSQDDFHGAPNRRSLMLTECIARYPPRRPTGTYCCLLSCGN